jgi:hypothetical protein
MGIGLRSYPRTWAADIIQGRTVEVPMATIATTGTGEVNVIAPVTGRLVRAWFVGKDALVQHGSNYITWAIVNKGQAGAGTTAMLAATDANTTKTTTGAATAAFTARALTLHGTAANLRVVRGDTLNVTVAATGTLANTITFPTIVLEFEET